MFVQNCRQIKDFSLGGKTWGDSACALSDVFHLAELARSEFYSPGNVMIKALEMMKAGAIDKDFFVTWDKAFKILGVQTVTKFEGPEYDCKPWEHEFLYLQRPGFKHFVVGCGHGHTAWDSLGIREQSSEYELLEKRIISIKRIL